VHENGARKNGGTALAQVAKLLDPIPDADLALSDRYTFCLAPGPGHPVLKRP
jgi:hypothetical protein